jgi:hypothetical protein
MDLIHITEWLHNDIPDDYFIEKVIKWYDTDSGVIKHLIPEKTGSSSNLGKHCNTIIMNILESTAKQSAFNRLDLIDSNKKIFNAIKIGNDNSYACIADV